MGIISMETGYALYVAGEVAGDWTNINDYYVVGDLVVPDGLTLNIDSGVKVLFTGNYNLDVEGHINAIGSEDEPIYFTSNQPTPAPSDWGVIELHSSANTFKYVYYEYANNGIEGDDGSGSVFENCTIRNIPVFPDEEGRWHCHGRWGR